MFGDRKNKAMEEEGLEWFIGKTLREIISKAKQDYDIDDMDVLYAIEPGIFSATRRGDGGAFTIKFKTLLDNGVAMEYVTGVSFDLEGLDDKTAQAFIKNVLQENFNVFWFTVLRALDKNVETGGRL